MSINIVRLGTIAVAGTLAGGLLALPLASSALGSDNALKRDEDTIDVVTVDDEDDDDTKAKASTGTNTNTGTNTGGNTGTNTGNTNTGTGTGSGDQNDSTNSRSTGVSRDDDHSRGDKTKDWTGDGGDRTRDHSANNTNDGSRNDTPTLTARWGLSEGDPITAELTAIKLLGGGNAYEAYLAFDEVTYAAVVVKLLRPDQVDDESSLRGLRREAATLALVNHPVVVRGLRHELDGGRPHLVLEHIDGPRLSSLVRRYGPLQEQQYLPLAVDIASALHYFRRVEVVHLDIKPSNIIMGAPARLIDLSVARDLDLAAASDRPDRDGRLPGSRAGRTGRQVRRAGRRQRRLGAGRDRSSRGCRERGRSGAGTSVRTGSRSSTRS